MSLTYIYRWTRSPRRSPHVLRHPRFSRPIPIYLQLAILRNDIMPQFCSHRTASQHRKSEGLANSVQRPFSNAQWLLARNGWAANCGGRRFDFETGNYRLSLDANVVGWPGQIVHRLSDYWSSCSQLRSQLRLLALKYPVDIEIVRPKEGEGLPSFKAHTTVLYPALEAKAIISFVFSTATFCFWPLTLDSLDCEVQVECGPIKYVFCAIGYEHHS